MTYQRIGNEYFVSGPDYAQRYSAKQVMEAVKAAFDRGAKVSTPGHVIITSAVMSELDSLGYFRHEVPSLDQVRIKEFRYLLPGESYGSGTGHGNVIQTKIWIAPAGSGVKELTWWDADAISIDDVTED